MQRWHRTIAHADMDAFYASAEQLDDPWLLGQAVIVGPKSLRGVALTASYEARRYGVKSAMPMAEAIRRCPDAVVVPPRFERYQELSESIMRAFADFSPHVEAISLDEAFLDMTGSEGLFGTPQRMAQQIQDAVYDATGGLTASVGIAATKYVAKVASDYYKPNGLTVVTPECAIDWLDPLPVSRLWGAGPKTVPRIQQLGLMTIGDIRRANPEFIKKNLGNMGLHFQCLANAQDPRRVARRRNARSMGSDRTLMQDVSSREEIEHYLRRSADRIGRRLRNKGYRTHGVRIKLKTNRFQLLTRQVQLIDSTDSADRMFDIACSLLKHFLDGNQFESGPFRLVGLAAYDLVRKGDPTQLDLFTGISGGSSTKPVALERTLDDIIARFGSNAVSRAADITGSRTVSDTSPTLDFIEHLDSQGTPQPPQS